MPQSRKESDEKLLADVAAYGWHVVNVFKAGGSPPFTYSIGFHYTFGHPEVIVIGLEAGDAHALINLIGAELKGGRRFHAGRVYDDLLDGYAATFRAVPLRQYPAYLGFARWFYKGDRFPTLQMVFPDPDGRWPWHPDTNSGFRARQPVLAEAPVPPWADEAG